MQSGNRLFYFDIGGQGDKPARQDCVLGKMPCDAPGATALVLSDAAPRVMRIQRLFP